MAIMGAVVLLTVVGGGALVVDNSRKDVESEIASSMALASRLVATTLSGQGPVVDDTAMRTLFDALERLRHLEVVPDPELTRRFTGATGTARTEAGGAPAWFTQLLYPFDVPSRRFEFEDAGEPRWIVLEGNPDDEVVEIWEDVLPLAWASVALFVVIALLVYGTLWLGLRPLEDLAAGFQRLEAGVFDVNLDEDGVSELSRINRQFNRMVSVLRQTMQDNAMLARSMVNLQEEERRSITRELHDDMAPQLFSIRVAVSETRAQIAAGHAGGAGAQLDDIDALVGQLQGHVRGLLGRLRPQVLDDLGLADALRGLIETWQRREPATEWTLDTTALPLEIESTLSVTVYRVVQECLTNAARHARARHVDVTFALVEEASRPDAALEVTVEDDGVGLPGDVRSGFGILGMRERVRALGGVLCVAPGQAGGLKVSARLPLARASAHGPVALDDRAATR